MKNNGYVIWQDSQRVAIATGFRDPSDNDKTGNMIQVWFLLKHQSPIEAIRSGNDRLICFSCRHRGDGHGNGRSCYVTVWQAPTSVYNAYKRGSYPVLPSWDLFSGHKVRFGAYGEPILLPLDVIHRITANCTSWTGYTHQWRRSAFQAYKEFFQASVDSLSEAMAAQGEGWSTFRVLREGETPEDGRGICGAETPCDNESNGTTCADCLACNGRSKQNKTIYVHGSLKVNFQ